MPDQSQLQFLRERLARYHANVDSARQAAASALTSEAQRSYRDAANSWAVLAQTIEEEIKALDA